ncbi:MAG: pyrroline-5-carboxylate reductase [Chlorobi bacterium]|nr:pyrroline-5-carboxylate reductase [Chlorobiota bacterium]
MNKKIAIIGAGNLGKAIAKGLLISNLISPNNLTLTRRKTDKLNSFSEKGVKVTSNNIEATKNSDILIVCVKPHKFEAIINEIRPELNNNHILISTVTGLDIKHIINITKKDIAIYRAMPNTAISIQESMTCISSNKLGENKIEIIKNVFDKLGKSVVIDDELMGAATVLSASGIAFALRYIRASMQAGIEIGFNSELAQLIASQTVKGASSLIISEGAHPESEVDKVTTPLGITITGLNKMEYNGFSSSIIQGVLNSYEKIKNISTK